MIVEKPKKQLEEFICTLLRLRGLMQRKEEEEIIRRYVTTGNGVSARVVPGLKQNSNDQVKDSVNIRLSRVRVHRVC